MVQRVALEALGVGVGWAVLCNQLSKSAVVARELTRNQVSIA